MEKVPVGELISGQAFRDAIHIAIEPVVAHHDLRVGADVGILPGIGRDKESGLYIVGYSNKSIGIVDPFLDEDIKQGQKFYLFLYPNTVISLRHVWTHPVFSNVGVKAP